MKNEKTFDEMLSSTLNLIVNIYALAEYSDQYFYNSYHGEMDSTELIENITFNLEAIQKYHFGDDEIKETDYVRDDYTAAQAIIEAIMSIVNFMVDYTSPQHIYALLNERAKDIAESLILCITHDGIDTIENGYKLAYAYKILGERAAYYANVDGGKTPLKYFDTDSVTKSTYNRVYGIVLNERGAGKKLYNYEQAIKRIKKTLRSDLDIFNTLDEVKGTIEALENSLNGINTTEVRDIITDRKESE